MLDTVRDTYTALEASRRELLAVTYTLRPSERDIADWVKSAKQQSGRWESAYNQYSSALDSVVLVGSDNVSSLAQQFDWDAFMLTMSIQTARGVDDPNTTNVDIDTVKEETKKLREAGRQLLTAMRDELHPRSPTQAPTPQS